MFNLNAVQQEVIENQNDPNFIKKLAGKRYALNVSSLLFLIEKFKKQGAVEIVEFLQSNEIWTPLVKLLLNDENFNITVSLRFSEDASAARSYIIIADALYNETKMIISRMKELQNDINDYTRVLNEMSYAMGVTLRESRDEKRQQYNYFENRLRAATDRYYQFERDQDANNYVNMYLFFIRVWNSMVHIHYNPETNRIVSPKYDYGSVSDLIVWIDLNVNADNYADYLNIRQTYNDTHPVYIQLPDKTNMMVDLTNGLVRPLNRRLLDITILKSTEIAEIPTSTWAKQATMATAGVAGVTLSILGLLYAISEVQARVATLTFRNPVIDDSLANIYDQLQVYQKRLYDFTVVHHESGKEFYPQEYVEKVNNLKEAFKEASKQLEFVQAGKEDIKRALFTTMAKAGVFITGLMKSSLRPAYEFGKDVVKRYRYDPNTLDTIEPNNMKLYDRDYPPVLLIISSPLTEGVQGVFRLVRDEGEPPQLVPLNVYKHFDLENGRLNYQIKNE